MSRISLYGRLIITFLHIQAQPRVRASASYLITSPKTWDWDVSYLFVWEANHHHISSSIIQLPVGKKVCNLTTLSGFGAVSCRVTKPLQ
jgi:hypothetical protein